MIRIDRGAEPQRLRRVQVGKLAGWSSGKRIRLGTGYQFARGELWERQHRKCVYCERQQGLAGQPVEHFRPKGGADRGDPCAATPKPTHRDMDHYWWLAWSWENLFFSCTRCNVQGQKGNWFPLVPRTVPLTKPAPGSKVSTVCFDVAAEKPLLIDPGRENPRDHIVWLPENHVEREWSKLRWKPMHKTPRGRATIAIFHMRGDLADHVSDHIEQRVVPALLAIDSGCTRAGRPRRAAKQRWRELIRSLFAPMQPYHAASHDALEWFKRQRPKWSSLRLPA